MIIFPLSKRVILCSKFDFLDPCLKEDGGEASGKIIWFKWAIYYFIIIILPLLVVLFLLSLSLFLLLLLSLLLPLSLLLLLLYYRFCFACTSLSIF